METEALKTARNRKSQNNPNAIGINPAGANSSQKKRGRKPAGESRASEIRTALAEWRQTPVEQRVSLRALAAELRTSHQLLCSYLRTLDAWLNNQRSEEFSKMAKEISNRAAAEGRSMTQNEQTLFMAFSRESVRSALMAIRTETAERVAREMRQAVKKAKRAEAGRCATFLARLGKSKKQSGFYGRAETSHSAHL